MLDAEQQRLVEDNLRLVRYIVARYFASSDLEKEDIVSEGYLALCRAAGKYKPESGTTFLTYAFRCIMNAIYNAHSSPKSRTWSLNGQCVSSLNDCVANDNVEDGIELIDMIKDQKTDVEREAINNVICESIAPYAPTLVLRERTESTYRELAETLGMSHQNVHRKCDREARIARAELFKRGICTSDVA